MGSTFAFSIPTKNQKEVSVSISCGSSAIFVGANGGGKTRLSVYIEQKLQLKAHRISAHRALALNPDVAKISEKKALMGLRTENQERPLTSTTERVIDGVRIVP